jgi:cold shock CspA family protein
MGRHMGTVKKIVLGKGFGFITEDEGDDVFFYRKQLDPSLVFGLDLIGQRVTFDTEEGQGDKGPRAVNVRSAH